MAAAENDDQKQQHITICMSYRLHGMMGSTNDEYLCVWFIFVDGGVWRLYVGFFFVCVCVCVVLGGGVRDWLGQDI